MPSIELNATSNDEIDSGLTSGKNPKNLLQTIKNSISSTFYLLFSLQVWKERIRSFIKLLKRKEFYESLLLCYGFIPLGLGISTLGPTLPFLSENVKTDVDTMGWVFTCRGVGYILTSMGGGYLLDVIKSKVKSELKQTILNQLLIFIGMILISGSFFIIPFITQFWILCAIYFITGLGLGLVDLISNVLMIWIWGKDKALGPFMQLLHAFFGVGALIAPLFLKAALNQTKYAPTTLTYFICAIIVATSVFTNIIFCLLAFKQSKDNEKLERITTENELVENSIQMDDEEDELERELKEENERNDHVLEFTNEKNNIEENINLETINEEKETTKINNNEEEDQHLEEYEDFPLWRKIALSLLTAFALFNYVGCEIDYGGLIFTYLHDTKLTTDDEASLINSGFWLSFTIFRFLGVILTSIFPDAVLLIVDSLFCFVGLLPILIFPKSIAAIWVGSIILGFAFATQFPLTIALPSSYMKIQVTGWMTSVMVIGAVVGELIVPVLMTNLFKFVSPFSLFWLILGVCTIAFICYIVLLVAFRPKKITININ
ncbi:hypothetical protein ABK040_012720 [Willaertia magna]